MEKMYAKGMLECSYNPLVYSLNVETTLFWQTIVNNENTSSYNHYLQMKVTIIMQFVSNTNLD